MIPRDHPGPWPHPWRASTRGTMGSCGSSPCCCSSPSRADRRTPPTRTRRPPSRSGPTTARLARRPGRGHARRAPDRVDGTREPVPLRRDGVRVGGTRGELVLDEGHPDPALDRVLGRRRPDHLDPRHEPCTGPLPLVRAGRTLRRAVEVDGGHWRNAASPSAIGSSSRSRTHEPGSDERGLPPVPRRASDRVALRGRGVLGHRLHGVPNADDRLAPAGLPDPELETGSSEHLERIATERYPDGSGSIPNAAGSPTLARARSTRDGFFDPASDLYGRFG
jgi:hypothetical protein